MLFFSLRTEVLIFVVTICLSSSSVLFADLKITRIQKTAEFYEIVLNNDIKISNIFLRDNVLEFPKYKNKNKTYKQIVVLRKDFKNYLLGALLSNNIFSGKCITSFKINKMSVLKDNKSIKAFASIIFDDDIEVECRIMNGKKGLWIAWPSDLKHCIWIKNFTFINKNLQKDIEKKLIIDYTSIVS
ncbi:MAG: SpoVG family protein [Endomicrobium sp.]|jgi:DNA-binding cell septation regulator SpoVG|nr:SpoVG family protein [Endomicrobium sp.]